MTEQPATPTCVHCQAPLTDQAYLCHPDTAHLAADLRAVPDLLAELEVTTTRQARISAPARGNGDKPLPVDLRASDAATQVRTVLHGWTRVLLEEGDYSHDDWADAGRDAARWLGRCLADIRTREWAGELLTELRRAIDTGHAVIDRPEERLYAGPCGNPDSDPPCEATLWAGLEAQEVTCRTCGHVWDVNQRRDQLIAAAKDEWLDAVRVASLVSLVTRQRITPVVVNTLAEAGRITPLLPTILNPAGTATVDFHAVRQYRVRDVLDALKHIHDHKPATATEASAWLRDVHGYDVPRATVIKWGQRYPETVERDSGGKYIRAGVLAIARRLLHRAEAA